MEFKLSRSEISKVGFVSSVDTLKLLPFGKSKTQNVVVGDDTGSVSCFSMKRGESVTQFRTENKPGSEVCAVALGGSPSSQRDKVFYSTGQKIHGINRKGAEFFSLNTNLSENVQRMVVHDSKLYCTGDLSYTVFENGNEVHSMILPEHAKSLVVEDFLGSGLMPIVGSQDGSIRSLSNVNQPCEYHLEYGVTSLSTLERQGSSKQDLLYGTANGVIGTLEIVNREDGGVDFRKGTTISNESDERAPVSTLATHDLTQDDVKEVVVGREDGGMEVYALRDDVPVLQFETNLNESVQAIETGVVSTPGYDEIVVCTYSGNISSFTTEHLGVVDENDSLRRTKQVVHREAALKQLSQEVNELEENLNYSKKSLGPYLNDANGSGEMILPTSHHFKVKHSFECKHNEAAYVLSCEIPVPIDMITIHSTCNLVLLDVNGDDTGVQVLNKASIGQDRLSQDCDKRSDFGTVIRFTDTRKQVKLKFRGSEGQYGTINVIVVAQLSPPSAAQFALQLKPLSQHHRVKVLPQVVQTTAPEGTAVQETERIMNTLLVRGNFSLDRVHEWIKACVPDVPERPLTESVAEAKTESITENSILLFANSFTGSVLTVTYKDKEVRCESDSISTIAILRECFAREADNRSIQVDIQFDLKPDSVFQVLNCVGQRLSMLHQHASQAQLIEALQEVQLDEAHCEFLAPEYQEVLRNSNEIQNGTKQREKEMVALYGVITDLYIDMHKFQGRNVNDASTHDSLQHIFANFSLQSIVEFFSR